MAWQYAVEQHIAAGTQPPMSTKDLRPWLQEALGALRRLQHPGNHRYAWGLHRAVKLASTLPFPKRGL